MLWNPALATTSVVLVSAPKAFPNAASLDQFLLGRSRLQFEGNDGLHLAFEGHHQLWLPEKNPGAPLAVLIPLDDGFLPRIAAAVRFQRMSQRRIVLPRSRSLELTGMQRKRLVQMLRAFDGRQAGATYRDVAEAIFGQGAAREKGWKTHPVRGKAIRLVKDAAKMINNGYLKLLRGH